MHFFEKNTKVEIPNSDINSNGWGEHHPSDTSNCRSENLSTRSSNTRLKRVHSDPGL